MRFKQYLTEGVYDPAIFKAIFLAGGPGSGKSFVAQKSTGGMGLKIVNSDVLFEMLAKQAGIALSDMKSSGPEVKVRDDIRIKAKKLTARQMLRFINGRIGVVVDGTGRDFNKINKQQAMLKQLGYDTFMIFVNTSLSVALERNKKRERTVPEELVTKAWESVQHNIGKFQSLFGSNNFKIVDNNVFTDDKEIMADIWKEVMKFTKKPIENYIAKVWIEAELEKRKK